VGVIIVEAAGREVASSDWRIVEGSGEVYLRTITLSKLPCPEAEYAPIPISPTVFSAIVSENRSVHVS